MASRVAQVTFEHLTDVHSRRNAERVQNNVYRGPIREERHVLDRENLGDNTLVAVTAGELVTFGDLALLADIDTNQLIDARGQLIAVFA